MIDSKAEADKNKLSTDTLTYSDIKNEAEWSAETKGINLNIPGKGNTNEDRKAIGQKPNPDEGATPNFAGSEGEDSSTTKSAIAPGEIVIRSDDGKEEKDKTDITDLSRDPDTANNPLDKIFDKDTILEKQQAAALFGEIGFTLVGDLADKMGWKEGSAEKVLLHGLIAGLMAEINGGKFGEGLTNGAINEMIIGLIANHQKDLGLTGADTRWISALIGGAISEGLGGSFGQGAGIADSATKNNYLSHKQKEEKLKHIDACGDNIDCKNIWEEYYYKLDHSQGAWMNTQGIWDGQKSYDEIDEIVNKMYEEGNVGSWPGGLIESDYAKRASDAVNGHKYDDFNNWLFQNPLDGVEVSIKTDSNGYLVFDDKRVNYSSEESSAYSLGVTYKLLILNPEYMIDVTSNDELLKGIFQMYGITDEKSRDAFLMGMKETSITINGLAALGVVGSLKPTPSTGNSWKYPDGSIKYPPNNGAVIGTEKEIVIKPGTVIGRYGSEGGSYVTNQGASVAELSLPPGANVGQYAEYRVIKEIPKAVQGEIAPWFDQPGGGTQYKLPQTIQELLDGKYIEKI